MSIGPLMSITCRRRKPYSTVSDPGLRDPGAQLLQQIVVDPQHAPERRDDTDADVRPLRALLDSGRPDDLHEASLGDRAAAHPPQRRGVAHDRRLPEPLRVVDDEAAGRGERELREDGFEHRLERPSRPRR